MDKYIEKQIIAEMKKYEDSDMTSYDVRDMLNRVSKTVRARAVKMSILIVIVCFFIINFLITYVQGPVSPMDTTSFYSNDKFERICDVNNELQSAERAALIDEVQKTNNRLVKLILYVGNSDNDTNVVSDACNYNARTYEYYLKNTYTIILAYNVGTGNYAIIPHSVDVVKNSHIFDLLDTTTYLQNQGTSGTIAALGVNSIVAYGHILQGSPAEAYEKMWAYMNANGFSAEDEDHLANLLIEKDMKSQQDDNDMGRFFLNFLVGIVSVIVVGVCSVQEIYSTEVTGVYNELVKKTEREEKKKKAQARKQEAELKKQQLEQEKAVSTQTEMAKQPLENLTQSIVEIKVSDLEIKSVKNELLNRLEILENVLLTPDVENNMTSRFLNMYLPYFQENLDDIHAYARKHVTNYSTPEEKKAIKGTFDMYLTIINKMIAKSEADGTTNIDLNLKTLRSMATMDGMLDDVFEDIAKN